MKRALAERAKQSHSPTPQSPTTNHHHNHHLHVATSPTQQQQQQQPPPSSTSSPPRKIQRVNPPTTTTTTTPLSPPPQPPQTSTKKRQRPSSPPPSPPPSSSSDSEEDEEQKQNAFYLKHQNRALASELKSLKHSLKSLQREKRDKFRVYGEIGEKLEDLDCIWKEMECAVEVGLRQQLEEERGGGTNCLNLRQGIHTSSATKPEDEGGGNNHRKRTKPNNKNKKGDGNDDDEEDGDIVDATSYILELLSKLSSSSSEFKKEENESPTEEQSSAEFISQTKNRATVFRDTLFLLLKQVLHHDKDDGPIAEEEVEVKKEKTVKKEEKQEEEEVIPKPRKRGRPPRRRSHEVIKEDSEDEDENDTNEENNGESNNNLNGGEEGIEDVDISTKPFLITSLHKKINALQNTIAKQKCQMKDLTIAKEDAVSNEWKVRRGLYRIASGRMNIKEVLKIVEKGDKGASFEEWFEKNAPAGGSASVPSAVGSTAAAVGAKIGNADTPSATAAAAHLDGEKSSLNATEAAQFQKQIQDLKEITDCRDKKIKDLLREREENLKRINALMLSNSSLETNKADDSSSLSEEDVKRSSYYIETAAKLVSAERLVKDLTRETEKMRERWAVTKGDLDNAKKTIVDIEGKHSRRWKILTDPLASAVADTEEGDTSSSKNKDLYNGDKEDHALSATIMANFRQLTSNASKTVELQHKLRQALEGTRQVEMLRSSLADAHKMNESLQSKVDELRAKNAKFVAEKSAARASDSLGSSSSSSERSSSREHSSSHRSSSSGSSERHSSSTMEKLQRDNRRLKKELVAALGSKDSARSKQERAEKERDSLMKTNARVLKQSSEKDDMNQKSLSTILHLKSVTEELIQEKEILERKAKDAQQLALAARLAANAKERVEEEALKEKEIAEEKLLDCQNQLRSLMEDKDQADGRLSQSKSQMISLVKELGTAKQRCDELAAASTEAEEEKLRLTESLAITKKEAVEAAKKAASAAVANFSSGRGGGGGNSEFTAEQLTTQVKVLKSRLACPVCNDRDKKCILLRCRHMFCHQCVDKNIKNRSRKCPACGQRFDMKDVADVWL